MCTRAQNYYTIIAGLAGQPASAEAGFIASKDPNFDAEFSDINIKYLKAAAGGQVNSSSTGAAGNAPVGAENCAGVQISVAVKCGSSKNPIFAYLQGLIIFMGGLIGLAIVVSLIVSGIQYASSSGEPANIAKAKDRIFNAVLGLILYIMLGAVLRYLIPNIFT